ncbi:MAG: DNA-binding protein HU-beta, partial [uncultured Sphingomonas sp.]
EQAGTHHPSCRSCRVEPERRGPGCRDHAGGGYLDAEARRRSAARGVRQFLCDATQGVRRPQPAHRRATADRLQRQPQISPRQGTEGRRSI